jgi:hypothetical protein
LPHKIFRGELEVHEKERQYEKILFFEKKNSLEEERQLDDKRPHKKENPLLRVVLTVPKNPLPQIYQMTTNFLKIPE